MDHINMICLYLSIFFYRFHYVAVRMYMYLRGVETHNIFPIERYCSIKSSTQGKIVVLKNPGCYKQVSDLGI